VAWAVRVEVDGHQKYEVVAEEEHYHGLDDHLEEAEEEHHHVLDDHLGEAEEEHPHVLDDHLEEAEAEVEAVYSHHQALDQIPRQAEVVDADRSADYAP
jgi:vacuolar-type H+-ATPase subunit H